jgi:lysophospholipase L1-like esterase
MSRKLLIIGDSISLGVSELRGKEPAERVEICYVDLLTRSMPHVEIVVDAEVFRTAGAACNNIDNLLATHDPDVVLIMLGGNDTDMDWRRFILSGGKIARSRIPAETYEKNLRSLALKVLDSNAELVLTDFPSHRIGPRGEYISRLTCKDVSAMLEACGFQSISDTEVIEHRSAVARTAADLKIPLVRYGEVLDQYPDRMMAGVDGVHPTAAAHRLIARELMRVLIHLLQPATSIGHVRESHRYVTAG